jgi:redox-sensitive bicupin YhaK (pirin superfamily)
MQLNFIPSESRGRGEYGWLSTRYSFSFANYFNPDRMGFGALRVINDDTIAPGQGFGTHGHQDMEIITIPLSGTLAHRDSSGAVGTLGPFTVQTMSAGTGVEHSEYNASSEAPLTLFQIWILPRERDLPFRYQEKAFSEDAFDGAFRLLVGPDEDEGALPIYQDAFLFRGRFEAGSAASYAPKEEGHGVFVMNISGRGSLFGQELSVRDALEISALEPGATLDFHFPERSDFLLIEVPLFD